ncbi:hypothetical protein SAMN05216345_103495 [Cupriavidus sp. YR651]|nr:hypothetical protein SAMN05216345_103495 [Cupriavidus sp. YR651]
MFGGCDPRNPCDATDPSSIPASLRTDSVRTAPAPLGRLAAAVATVARRGTRGTVRALRGPDLRQTHVLMKALCEMRVELGASQGGWSRATFSSRRTATMALWHNRQRELFTQPEIERGIEDRLDAAFRHADTGLSREAAGELKRAYLLLCCVLTLARDEARRAGAPQRQETPQPARPPRPDAPLDRGA